MAVCRCWQRHFMKPAEMWGERFRRFPRKGLFNTTAGCMAATQWKHWVWGLLICTSMLLMCLTNPVLSGKMWRTDKCGFCYYYYNYYYYFLFLFPWFTIGFMATREWACAILYSIYNVSILTIPQPTTAEFKKMKLHSLRLYLIHSQSVHKRGLMCGQNCKWKCQCKVYSQ